MDHLLGIDVGTTGTKSALFTEDGRFVDIEYRAYPISYPEKGWAEQDPEDWWNALCGTVRAVVKRNDAAETVRSLSLSTQGGCLVLLDGRFSPVYSAVSWMDRRAGETSKMLLREIGMNELYKTCGWPVADSLPFPTICWFKQKRPGIFKKARYFASTIDYLNYLLTGRFAIDYTNLALTGFLDLGKRGFSERTVEIAGITKDNLPEIVPSGTVVGGLTAKAAKKLGLPANVPVVSGAHDRYCESIGAGAINAGDCVLGAGTSWVLLAAASRLCFHKARPDEKGFLRSIFPGLHPIEGLYGLMTVIPHGGNSLKWFRDVLRPESSFELLNGEASGIRAGSDGLMFFPISSSKSGKGAFLHIDGIHTRAHFTRAVYEGVAFMNRVQLDLFRQAGSTVRKLTMIGGGTKSSLWPGIVADVGDIPVEVPEKKEAACAGAWVLAAFGCGLCRTIREGSGLVGGEKTLIEPVKANAEIYRKAYDVYLDCLDHA
ncbi:MAG: hypothetical protein JXQ30_07555 [Spirochaetes bacterium]|nr:hypothetical protein [Spirochaetota bacterium]